jgi:hypothetical protein
MPTMEDRAGASTSACRWAATAERVVLCSAMGVAAALATTPPPLQGIAEGRRSKATEDDEDECRIPYLAC